MAVPAKLIGSPGEKPVAILPTAGWLTIWFPIGLLSVDFLIWIEALKPGSPAPVPITDWEMKILLPVLITAGKATLSPVESLQLKVVVPELGETKLDILYSI